MSKRLTKWEGRNVDGSPRAVLAEREGSWPEHFQQALRKLAEYEDGEEDLPAFLVWEDERGPMK